MFNISGQFPLKKYTFIIFQDSRKRRRQSSPIIIEPPHLCYNNSAGVIICQVYTEDTKNITIDVSLQNTDDDDDDWCKYKLSAFL